VIDIGAKRTASDFMPGRYKETRTGAIRVLLGIEFLGGSFSVGALAGAMNQITNAMIQEHWDRWGDLDDVTHLARNAARNTKGSSPAGLLAASMLYPEIGKEFLQGIAEMVGLASGDPRLALLKYNPPTKDRVLAAYAAIKPAQWMAQGRKMSVLRFTNREILHV